MPYLRQKYSYLLVAVVLIFVSTTLAWAKSGSYQEDIAQFHEENWELDAEIPPISDPHEGLNRKMFNFNKAIYDHLLAPVSKGYDFLVPKKVQSSIDNFFTNVRMPVRFLNCLFQGKFKGANSEMSRFLVNSTIGLGGFFDPATKAWHMAAYEEDFGQTLGKWGNGSGFYIVWPIVGPSSIRDTIGFIGDAALSPLTWFSVYEVLPDGATLGIGALNHINSFSLNIRDNYNSIYKSAIDPYIAIQDAYVQSREQKIKK